MSPWLILILVALMSIIKVSIISVSINKSYFSLFFSSFLFYNRVTIRNTFHEKLKEYYKRSNKINTIFYALLAVIISVYMLMRAI